MYHSSWFENVKNDPEKCQKILEVCKFQLHKNFSSQTQDWSVVRTALNHFTLQFSFSTYMLWIVWHTQQIWGISICLHINLRFKSCTPEQTYVNESNKVTWKDKHPLVSI